MNLAGVLAENNNNNGNNGNGNFVPSNGGDFRSLGSVQDLLAAKRDGVLDFVEAKLAVRDRLPEVDVPIFSDLVAEKSRRIAEVKSEVIPEVTSEVAKSRGKRDLGKLLKKIKKKLPLLHKIVKKVKAKKHHGYYY